MKSKKEDLVKKFNLPSYIKGKSFAEASKVIKKKFEGRNDKASKETEQALMQRLADMQEYIKAQQAPPQQYQQATQQSQPEINGVNQQSMQIDSTQNQAFLGGLLGGDKNDSFMDASGKVSGEAGAGAYLQGAETLFQTGNNMFGSTGVDTSGKTGNIKRHDTVGSTAASTVQGASAGAQIGGPLGAAIGGAVGLAGGIIGGKRKNDDIKEANQNFDIGNANRKINSFKLGGYQNQYKYGNDDRNTPLIGLGVVEPLLKAPDFSNMSGGSDSWHTGNNNVDYNSKSGEDYIAKLNEYNSLNKRNPPTNKKGSKSILKEDKTQKNKDSRLGDFLKKSSKRTDLLRGAPIVSDAYQLFTQEDPEVEVRQKLDKKYNPQLIDENRIQRDIRANQSNTDRSLINVSGGSKGFVASNMLGSDLNTSKAIANAATQAQAQNNNELKFKQQFDQNSDQFNIGQNNLEQDLTDRNKAAYDTNKSQLIDSLGDNLGKLGQEELYKQFPERLGFKFDSKGRVKIGDKYYTKEDIENMTEEEKASLIKSQESNSNAKGGYISTFKDHMNYLKQ